MNTIQEAREWFKQAGFGMMIHWGLYCLPAGEWKGERMNDWIGEWIQQYFRIPNREYHQLTKAFNPVYFDADEWAQLAAQYGRTVSGIPSSRFIDA